MLFSFDYSIWINEDFKYYCQYDLFPEWFALPADNCSLNVHSCTLPTSDSLKTFHSQFTKKVKSTEIVILTRFLFCASSSPSSFSFFSSSSLLPLLFLPVLLPWILHQVLQSTVLYCFIEIIINSKHIQNHNYYCLLLTKSFALFFTSPKLLFALQM